MATTTAKPKELLFSWEGKDAQNKPARGEIRAPSEASARTALRRQGVVVTKITKTTKDPLTDQETVDETEEITNQGRQKDCRKSKK